MPVSVAYVQPFSASQWWCWAGWPPRDHRKTATPAGTKLVIQASEKKKNAQSCVMRKFTRNTVATLLEFNSGSHLSGVIITEPVSCDQKIAGSLPLVCMSKCLWAKY